MSDDFESGSRLARGARLLAALDAANAAAARVSSEQGAANAAMARQRSELETAQHSGQKLSARGRDIRNSLLLLREAIDRAKLTALNAGLEGARLADPVGRALVVMGDEVRSLMARAIDALEEHSGLLAEVDRDRDRCLSELGQLSDGAREVSARLAQAQEQSQLSAALLGELRHDLSELFGPDLQAAQLLAQSSNQVNELAATLADLAQRSPASAQAIRELLGPLLALAPGDPPR